VDILEAIQNRRSIRSFKNQAVPKEILQKILLMGSKAPSGKNRQPWHFLILQDKDKEQLTVLMNKAASEKEKQAENIGSLRISSNAIKESSAVFLVYNSFSKAEQDYNHYRLLMDTQSIGAAIQNIILAAEAFGLGALWICDIFQCHKAISIWFNESEELVAAVAVGYPNQSPSERPRKSLEELVDWRY